MKCILVKSDPDNPDYDWYCIERAEHDGREWMRRTGPNSQAFMRSARLGEGDNNYCIEGTAFEMLAIAEAIEQKKSARFKRCAATFAMEGYEMESPRNSRAPVLVSHSEASELAADIRQKIHAAQCEEGKP